MKLWGVTEEQLTGIVTAVSKKYDGNIVFKRAPERDGRAVAFTLTVRTSKGPAGRRSHTGRRVCACCWHGHRDVMSAIFAVYPDARLKSSFADYKGRSDFEDKFEATGFINIGSGMLSNDACDCGGSND